MNVLFVLAVAFVAVGSGLLGGCALLQQPHTAAGIQPAEARVLKANYWQPGVGPEHFTDAEVRLEFMRAQQESRYPANGERTELRQARLLLVLACVGDARFTSLLSQQPRDIRVEVLRYVKVLWTREDSRFRPLRYPATEVVENYAKQFTPPPCSITATSLRLMA